MNRHQLGFGLLEMLVAMGLLGIILTAIVAVENNTLKYSSQQQDRASKLITLAEVSGYLGDRARTAVQVRTTGVTVNGLACASTSTTNPCFALMVPASMGTDATRPNKVDAYLFMAYRLEARSSIASDYKTVNPWADTNTMVLKEYRATVCRDSTTGVTPCNGTVPAMPTSVTGASWYLVGDNLTMRNQSGVAFVPFEYDGTLRQVTLRLQVASQIRGKAVYVPGNGPQSFRIHIRNQ